MTADVAVYALRVAVAGTFLLAAAGKARNLAGFAQAVTNLTGLRARAARPAAVAVLATEVALAAALLLWPRAATVTLALSAAVLVAFGALLARVLGRAYRPACNCFGTSERPVSPLDVVRNGLLAAGCVAGAGLAPGAVTPALGPLDRTLVVLAALALGLVVAHLHDVVTTLRRPLPDVRLTR